MVDSGITTGFSTQLWLFFPLRSISYEESVRAYRTILHDRCRLVLDADLVELRAAYSSWVEASRNETAKENGERWSTTRSFAGCIISRKTRQWETKASAISISRPINYYFFRHSTDATFYRCQKTCTYFFLPETRAKWILLYEAHISCLSIHLLESFYPFLLPLTKSTSKRAICSYISL